MNQSPSRGRVLVLDVDARLAELVTLALLPAGLQVERATNRVQAIQLVHDFRHGVLIVGTGGRGGFDLSAAYALIAIAAGRRIRLVVLDGFPRTKPGQLEEPPGVDAYLIKPFVPSQLCGIVEALLPPA
jgi:DNA-binding response OmpR family regulator